MENSGVERGGFLPERQGVGVSKALDVLRADPEYRLNAEQRTRIVELDNQLTRGKDIAFKRKQTDAESEFAQGIETIYKTSVRAKKWHPEYFLTQEGAEHLRSTFNLSEQPSFTSADDVFTFFASVDYRAQEKGFIKKLRSLHRASGEWMENRVVQSLKENDYASLDVGLNPESFTVLENPEIFIKYVKALRTFKELLRSLSRELEREGMDEAEREAKRVIINMHRARVNQMIAGQYSRGVALVQQHQHLLAQTGESHLADLVDGLQGMLKGMSPDNAIFSEEKRRLQRMSLLDHFIYGASQLNESKLYSAISAEAHGLAESLEAHEVESHESSGWLTDVADIDALSKIYVDPEILKSWCEKVLRSYDLLSEEPFLGSDKEYKRSGRAKDGKVQIAVDTGRKTFSYNSRTGILKVPAKIERALYEAGQAGAAVVIDHELAHVIQNEAAQKYDLPLLEEVGSDRVGAHHEAGAIVWEREGKHALFGADRPTNTHYLRAIEKRLEGGTYVDCVLAFYQSIKKQSPTMDSEKAAKQAANRTRRLFRKGGNMQDASGILTSSATLMYLEQELLVQAMTELGNEELLLRGKANIFTLSELHRVGLVDNALSFKPPQRPTEVIRDDIIAFVKTHV